MPLHSRAPGARRAPRLFACALAAAALATPTFARAQPRSSAAGQVTVGSPATPAGPARKSPARPLPVAAAPQPPASRPSPPVVAVVHRLRGWKLRALFTPPDAPFAATFDDKFVRSSVVAGYVLPDGRTILSRLPRAEAEMLNISSLFPDFYGARPGQADSDLLLMRQDGGHSPLKFVGFDSATGLSLLEAGEPVANERPPARADSPTVGERVRLVAPLPAAVAEALAATEAEAKRAAEANEDGPVGVSGVLYMSLAEMEGRLTGVSRSPAGRAVALTLQTERAASPEWAGSVALTEAGALAGIVEQSGGREARLLPAEVVRAAAERVQRRRASVPQPWLGARGDAVAESHMEFFLSRGWPRAQAGELLRRRQGVMLTSVAPDSPAARAGLRPGDVVSRIDNFDVRGVEDMSLLLREAGGNRPSQFTVHRANESPRSLQVRLSEAQNPALETARAEARAAEIEKSAAEAALRGIDGEMRSADEQIRALDELMRKSRVEDRDAVSGVRRRQTLRQIDDLRRRLAELNARQIAAETEFVRKRERLEEANARLHAATRPGGAAAFRPLLPFGVKAMLYMTSITVAGRDVTDHGLVVLEVDHDSPAERVGLRAGDVIESIDGQSPHALDLSDVPPAELDGEPSLDVRRGGRRLVIKLGRASH